MDPELEAGAEAQAAQDPQVILLKPPVRVAHGADEPALEVLDPFERVPPFVPPGVVGDRVDGEVPAREVVHQGHPELHHGVPPVGLQVPAERGDFVGPAVPVQDGDRAMLDAHGDGALEELAHLLGRRRGRQVEVVILEPEQIVPDRTPDAPGLVAGVFELLGDLQHLVGDGEAVRKPHELRITRTTHSPH